MRSLEEMAEICKARVDAGQTWPLVIDEQEWKAVVESAFRRNPQIRISAAKMGGKIKLCGVILIAGHVEIGIKDEDGEWEYYPDIQYSFKYDKW